MKVFQCTSNLVDVVRRERVAQAFQLGECPVEFSVSSIFHHKINVLVVLEPAVEGKTIFVQDICLDLDLPDDLLLYVVRQDFLLGHHLQSTDKATALFTHTIDLPKFTLPQPFPNVEISKLPLA